MLLSFKIMFLENNWFSCNNQHFGDRQKLVFSVFENNIQNSDFIFGHLA